MDVREPVCRELGKNLSGRGNRGAQTLRWEHAWHECLEDSREAAVAGAQSLGRFGRGGWTGCQILCDLICIRGRFRMRRRVT